jgi:hypothetical protein
MRVIHMLCPDLHAQEEGKLTDSNQYLILPIPIIKVLLEQWGRVIV